MYNAPCNSRLEVGQELWNGRLESLCVKYSCEENWTMHSILDVYSRYRRDLKIQRCADEPRELRHRSYGNRSVGDPPNIVNTARVPPTREFVNNRDSNFLCTTEELGSSSTNFFDHGSIHDSVHSWTRGFIATSGGLARRRSNVVVQVTTPRRNWKRFLRRWTRLLHVDEDELLSWSYQILKSMKEFLFVLILFRWFEVEIVFLEFEICLEYNFFDFVKLIEIFFSF